MFFQNYKLKRTFYFSFERKALITFIQSCQNQLNMTAGVCQCFTLD